VTGDEANERAATAAWLDGAFAVGSTRTEAGGWAPQPTHHTHNSSANNRFTGFSLTSHCADGNRENRTPPR
jgi:hypothetical protein